MIVPCNSHQKEFNVKELIVSEQVAATSTELRTLKDKPKKYLTQRNTWSLECKRFIKLIWANQRRFVLSNNTQNTERDQVSLLFEELANVRVDDASKRSIVDSLWLWTLLIFWVECISPIQSCLPLPSVLPFFHVLCCYQWPITTSCPIPLFLPITAFLHRMFTGLFSREWERGGNTPAGGWGEGWLVSGQIDRWTVPSPPCLPLFADRLNLAPFVSCAEEKER